jgi:hypothetical protein
VGCCRTRLGAWENQSSDGIKNVKTENGEKIENDKIEWGKYSNNDEI